MAPCPRALAPAVRNRPRATDRRPLPGTLGPTAFRLPGPLAGRAV